MTTPVKSGCFCWPWSPTTKSVDSGSKSVEKESIQASPAGHWGENGFQPGPNTQAKVTDAFKKEFEGGRKSN